MSFRLNYDEELKALPRKVRATAVYLAFRQKHLREIYRVDKLKGWWEEVEKSLDDLDEPSHICCWVCGKILTNFEVDWNDRVKCCEKHGFVYLCEECLISAESKTSCLKVITV